MFSLREDPLIELEWLIDVLLVWLQPTACSEARRNLVADRVRSALARSPTLRNAGIFLTGSFPTKTFLPDADLDLALLLHRPSEEETPEDEARSVDLTWISAVNAALCEAALDQTHPNASVDPSLHIRNVTFVNGRVKVVTCLVGNVSVDLSFARSTALAAALLIEESDREVALMSSSRHSLSNRNHKGDIPSFARVHAGTGIHLPQIPSRKDKEGWQLRSRDHLLKRSLILVKAWCLYESGPLVAALAPWLEAVPVMCSRGGRLSTYAISAMVLSLFNNDDESSPHDCDDGQNSSQSWEPESEGGTPLGTSVNAPWADSARLSRNRSDSASSNGSSGGGSVGSRGDHSAHHHSASKKSAKSHQRSQSESFEHTEDDMAQMSGAAANEASRALAELTWKELEHPLLVLLRFLSVFSAFDWDRFALTVDFGAIERSHGPLDRTSSSPSQSATPPRVPLWQSARSHTSSSAAAPSSDQLGTDASESSPLGQVLSTVRRLREPSPSSSSSTTPSQPSSTMPPWPLSPSFASAPMVIVDPLDSANNLAGGVGVHAARAIATALELGKQRLEGCLHAHLAHHCHHDLWTAAQHPVQTSLRAPPVPRVQLRTPPTTTTTSSSTCLGSSSSQSNAGSTSTNSSRRATHGKPPLAPHTQPLPPESQSGDKTRVGLGGGENGLVTSLDFLQYMFPVTFAAYGQIPGLGSSQESPMPSAPTSSHPHPPSSPSSPSTSLPSPSPPSPSAHKRPVVVVGPAPSTRRRRCRESSDLPDFSNSDSHDGSSSSSSETPPFPPLSVPLRALTEPAAALISRALHAMPSANLPQTPEPPLVASSPPSPLLSRLGRPSSLSSAPSPPHETAERSPQLTASANLGRSSPVRLSPSDKLGIQLHSLVTALLTKPELEVIYPVNMEKNGDRVIHRSNGRKSNNIVWDGRNESVSRTVGNGAERLKEHRLMPSIRGLVLQFELYHGNDQVLDDGLALPRVSDDGSFSTSKRLASKVTGMLLDALPSEIIQMLVQDSDTLPASLASSHDESARGFDLVQLVCQALETLEKFHAVDQRPAPERKEDEAMGGETLNRSCRGSSSSNNNNNNSSSSSGSVSAQSGTGTIDRYARLMVEGNGFRSDLLDHPMQQSVTFANRLHCVSFLQKASKDIQAEEGTPSTASKESGGQNVGITHSLEKQRLLALLNSSMEGGTFGYDIGGACLDGDSAQMVAALRKTVDCMQGGSGAVGNGENHALAGRAAPLIPSGDLKMRKSQDLVDSSLPSSSSTSLGIAESKQESTTPLQPQHAYSHRQTVVNGAASQETSARLNASATSNACAVNPVSIPKGIHKLSGSSSHGAVAGNVKQRRRGKNKNGFGAALHSSSGPPLGVLSRDVGASSSSSLSSAAGNLDGDGALPTRRSWRNSLLGLRAGSTLAVGGVAVAAFVGSFITGPFPTPSASSFFNFNVSLFSTSSLSPHGAATVLENRQFPFTLHSSGAEERGRGPSRLLPSQRTETRRSKARVAGTSMQTHHSETVLAGAGAGAAGSSSYRSAHSSAAETFPPLGSSDTQYYDGGRRRRRRRRFHVDGEDEFENIRIGENEREQKDDETGASQEESRALRAKAEDEATWSLRRSTEIVFRPRPPLSLASSPNESPPAASSSSSSPSFSSSSSFPHRPLSPSVASLLPPSSSSTPTISGFPTLPPALTPLPPLEAWTNKETDGVFWGDTRTDDLEETWDDEDGRKSEDRNEQQQKQHQQHWVMAGGSVLLGDLNAFGLNEESKRSIGTSPSGKTEAVEWKFLWQKDGEVMPSATKSFITIDNAAASDSGEYSCFVRKSVVPVAVEKNEPLLHRSSRDDSNRIANANPLRRLESIQGRSAARSAVSPEKFASAGGAGDDGWGGGASSFGAFSVEPAYSAALRVASPPSAPQGLLVRRSVVSGSTLSLEVPHSGVGGFPLPRCRWSFQGFPLVENSVFKGGHVVTSDTGAAASTSSVDEAREGGKAARGTKEGGAFGARLRVSNISAALAGTYTCDCVNEVGSVRWTEALVDVVDSRNDDSGEIAEANLNGNPNDVDLPHPLNRKGKKRKKKKKSSGLGQDQPKQEVSHSAKQHGNTHINDMATSKRSQVLSEAKQVNPENDKARDMKPAAKTTPEPKLESAKVAAGNVFFASQQKKRGQKQAIPLE